MLHYLAPEVADELRNSAAHGETPTLGIRHRLGDGARESGLRADEPNLFRHDDEKPSRPPPHSSAILITFATFEWSETAP